MGIAGYNAVIAAARQKTGFIMLPDLVRSLLGLSVDSAVSAESQHTVLDELRNMEAGFKGDLPIPQKFAVVSWRGHETKGVPQGVFPQIALPDDPRPAKRGRKAGPPKIDPKTGQPKIVTEWTPGILLVDDDYFRQEDVQSAVKANAGETLSEAGLGTWEVYSARKRSEGGYFLTVIVPAGTFAD